MKRCVLAIDLGTTVVKALVFDATGAVVSAARAATPLLDAGPGRSEIDMDALWTVAADLIRQAAAVDAVAIEAIAASGTAGGAWLVAADHRPVRNAILWNDGRAAPQIAAWQADGTLDRVFAITRNVIFPGYTAAVLRWLDDNEPDSLDRTAAAICCKDWIRLKLTGKIATDPTDASGFPHDIVANRFSADVFELCGIGHRFDLLPEIIASGAEAGVLSPEAARALGLRSGTPVLTGMMDVGASMLGAGAIEPGTATTILGTSCLNTLVLAMPPPPGPAVGITLPSVAGRYLRALVNTAGTINLDWFLREIWGDSDIARFEAAVAAVPVGARGLLYHPYLSAAGLMSPFVHPHARAQFFGLSPEHDRRDMGRAVVEGVAFAIRDCFAAMPDAVRSLRLIGGGSRSPLWGQIIADCLGIVTTVPKLAEPGAWGSAMLALVATGMADSLESLAGLIEAERTHEPDPKRHAQYSANFALYREIAMASSPHWTRRADIVASG